MKKIGKKGGIEDLMYIMVIIVVVGFLILITFNVLSKFNTAVQDSDTFNQNAKNVANAVTSKFPGVIDNTFLILTIGLCMVAVVLAFLVRVHPIFFIFFLVLMPIMIFITGAFSNLYNEAASNPAFADAANQMVFMSHIVRYLPIIIGVFGFILAFVMYNTWRSES